MYVPSQMRHAQRESESGHAESAWCMVGPGVPSLLCEPSRTMHIIPDTTCISLQTQQHLTYGMKPGGTCQSRGQGQESI